jgi:hypothetical protein
MRHAVVNHRIYNPHVVPRIFEIMVVEKECTSRSRTGGVGKFSLLEAVAGLFGKKLLMATGLAVAALRWPINGVRECGRLGLRSCMVVWWYGGGASWEVQWA